MCNSFWREVALGGLIIYNLFANFPYCVSAKNYENRLKLQASFSGHSVVDNCYKGSCNHSQPVVMFCCRCIDSADGPQHATLSGVVDLCAALIKDGSKLDSDTHTYRQTDAGTMTTNSLQALPAAAAQWNCCHLVRPAQFATAIYDIVPR